MLLLTKRLDLPAERKAVFSSQTIHCLICLGWKVQRKLRLLLRTREASLGTHLPLFINKGIIVVALQSFDLQLGLPS